MAGAPAQLRNEILQLYNLAEEFDAAFGAGPNPYSARLGLALHALETLRVRLPDRVPVRLHLAADGGVGIVTAGREVKPGEVVRVEHPRDYPPVYPAQPQRTRLADRAPWYAFPIGLALAFVRWPFGSAKRLLLLLALVALVGWCWLLAPRGHVYTAGATSGSSPGYWFDARGALHIAHPLTIR